MTETMTKPRIEAYGMGTVIINPHIPGKVLSLRERVEKPSTGRDFGQLSIPLETAVEGETFIGNLLGSLAEVLDDVGVSEVGSNFSLAPNGMVYVPSETNPGVYVQPALVVYDGDPEYPFSPWASDEVAALQWMPIEELTRQNPEVRSLAREVVVYEASRGRLSSLPEDRTPIFPPEFSMQAFCTERAKHPDRIKTL